MTGPFSLRRRIDLSMRPLLAAIVGIVIVPSVMGQVPSAGLVCHLTFDGSVTDIGPLGLGVASSSSVHAPDRNDVVGASLHLEGVSDSIRVALAGLVPADQAFTFSIWYRSASPEQQSLFCRRTTPEDTISNLHFALNTNVPTQPVLELHYGTFIHWNGSGAGQNALAEGVSGRFTDGRWHHHVLQRSSDTLRIWHDGDLYAETVAPGSLGAAHDLLVGGGPYGLYGDVDDLVVHDRALDHSEIQQLYHDRVPLRFIAPESTDAYAWGDTAWVNWRWDPVTVGDSIDLDLRLNGAGAWTPVGHPGLTAWTPYPLPMNMPVGTTVELRIRDRSDTSRVAYSGGFVVSSYRWDPVSPVLPFTPRDGVGLLAHVGRMWALGGWDPPYHPPHHTHSEVWSTMDGLNWTQHADAPWPGRHVSGWLVHDSALWVIGADPQSGWLQDVWRSVDGVTWSQVTDSIQGMSPSRTMHQVASIGDTILHFGGQQIDYEPGNLQEVWMSVDGLGWQQLPDAPWPGRGMVLNTCVDTAGGTCWLLGGGRLWDRRCYNDVWKTTNGTDWELVLASAPWSPRYWHHVAWFDDHIWVVAGVARQTDNAETWYSPDGISWRELKNSPFLPRHAGSICVFNDALWLMAGIASNDAWRLVNTSVPAAMEPYQRHPDPLIHPNPTDGPVDLGERARSVSVHDLAGRTLMVQRNVRTLDLSGLRVGCYVIVVDALDGSRSSHRVVRR